MAKTDGAGTIRFDFRSSTQRVYLVQSAALLFVGLLLLGLSLYDPIRRPYGKVDPFTIVMPICLIGLALPFALGRGLKFWSSGLMATDEGIELRSVLGRRFVPWSEVTGFFSRRSGPFVRSEIRGGNAVIRYSETLRLSGQLKEEVQRRAVNAATEKRRHDELSKEQ